MEIQIHIRIEKKYDGTYSFISVKQSIMIYKREKNDIEIGDFRSRKNILAAFLIPFLHFLALLNLIL